MVRRTLRPDARVELVFPPLFYYASVPADLLYTGSFLRFRGISVGCHDLNSGFTASVLAGSPAFSALRQRTTYSDETTYLAASHSALSALHAHGQQYGAHLTYQFCELAGVEPAHVPQALEVGLDPMQNPALRYLREHAVPQILHGDPALIALALVHPDQIVQVQVLARLLRTAGYDGLMVLYGSHEDVLSPESLIPDLAGEPPHLIFRDIDGVLCGEAETGLLALVRAINGEFPLEQTPSLLAPAFGLSLPPSAAHSEQPNELGPLDFGLINPALYPFPEPMVDLRLSRGCPWNRCTFCAITSHQAGYRKRETLRGVEDLLRMHASLGSAFAFFRDDLLTPAQFRELGAILPKLGVPMRFAARARISPGLDYDTLATAQEAGLVELWLGLESASARVRQAMDKGVADEIIERVLNDAGDLGLRVRVLCMVGYPGETATEVRSTFNLLKRHVFNIAHASLSPFQLMRGSLLHRDPARYGLTLLPDPLPRHERIRHTARAEAADMLSPARCDELVAEGRALLGGWLVGQIEGPTLAHAMIRSSVERFGWPPQRPDQARDALILVKDLLDRRVPESNLMKTLRGPLHRRDDQT